MRLALSALLASLITLVGCSSSTPAREVRNYGAGEKASVEHLTYTIVDTEIDPRLGDDANPRIPTHRFYLVQVSVSNGGNTDVTIPSMTLVDDGGQQFPELADGTGVQHWLGVVRKVGAGLTEQGYVLFDAPTAHYKLKLTDDTNDSDVYADIPLSFVHERMADPAAPVEGAATTIQENGPGDRAGKK
ncbi:MAG: DUF4352 domain-containing protein [Bryobacteraceae bacterium]|jgi:hypothetical protein